MTLKCQKQGHEIYIEKHEKNGKESLLLGKNWGTFLKTHINWSGLHKGQ